MSRALDQGAAASIMASDPQGAYHDIVEALHSNTSDLLDIELLGKSHPLPEGCNVLLDGTSIAIPKLKLVQAFVVARQIFFNCLKDFKEKQFQDIRNASAIILLMDPEHITAVNARKRIIQELRAGFEAGLHIVLRRELLAVDSFLTSRLYRHTKSPTLWGHRRWLVQVLKSMNFPHDIQRDLTTVVLVAAERHPRNYYAWLHLRWLLQVSQSSRNLSYFDASKVLSVVKDWCLMHPSDTSGWSFVLFCLFSIEASKSAWMEANSSICKEVLGLTESFKWTHESIWVFLRTLVAARGIGEEQRASFFKTIQATITTQPENSKVRNMLKASHDWCIEYSV